MATTESKSGFRLPWSSDRSHDAQAAEAAEVAAAESAEPTTGPADVAWPSSDLNDRLGLTSQPRPADVADRSPAEVATQPDPQEPAMMNAVQAAPAPVAPRKSSPLMENLSKAIRATAQAASEQALAQVDADVATVVEQIRTGAKEGEGTLRRTCDEDVTAIKDWSRAEIARIKEQTDAKIVARKSALEGELAAHAAAIEERVGEVAGAAGRFRDDMAKYAAGLDDEWDPSMLATMAESMPEPPAIHTLADLADLEIASIAADEAVEAVDEALEAADEAPEAVADGETVAEGELAEVALPTWAQAEPGSDPADAEATSEAAAEGAVEAEAEAEAVVADGATAEGEAETRGSAWTEDESHWGAATAVATVEAEDDDVPRWTAGETPEGFPSEGEGAEAGDPVDRGAIMAALEAAAEAVVAAESAAESADQAEAAADVAETAAELLKGKYDTDDEVDPEAAAALSARMGAGGLEESYADRLASLLPHHGEADGDGEPRTTQVVVSGLVSVASIASFKRHLGKLTGVTAVAVASGPDGEFVFNVTHRPDVSFRDALPTMPGFAARVTSTADGVVQVSARDPESEG